MKTKKRKNKIVWFCSLVLHDWLITLAFVTLCVIPNTKAEVRDGYLSLTPVSAPTLERVDQPNQTYHPGEIIAYRIQVRWPTKPVHEVRMIPPDLTLNNLELLGISQEVTSKPESPESAGEVAQTLAFRFVAKKPGRATLERFSLRWVQLDGAMVSALTIPALELTITPKPYFWQWIAVTSGGTLMMLAVTFLILRLRRSKRQEVLRTQAKSLEELTLNELDAIRTVLKSEGTQGTRRDILSKLACILERYCSQKLDWNPTRDGYNALQKKVEGNYSKKEALELSELFCAVEHERFSGEEIQEPKLLSIHQAICSFIERKKVI